MDPPEWFVAEDDHRQGMVWLVTFAAVLAPTAAQSVIPLRTLDGVTRQGVRDAVLDVVAHRVREPALGGRPQTVELCVLKMVVFLEEPKHFHVAVNLSGNVRFLPMKLALRHRSGLASHWSSTHTEWWSVVRYDTFTTATKPKIDEEPLVWQANGGELNLFEESQEPFIARVAKRRREQAATKAAGVAFASGTKVKAERFSTVDFKALVLAEGLKTPNAVMEYVQLKGSVAAQEFVSRHQARLRQFLEEAEVWSQAPEAAAKERQSDWSLLEQLAGQQCPSEPGRCEWLAAASAFFTRNIATLDEHRFAASVVRVVTNGTGKTLGCRCWSG